MANRDPIKSIPSKIELARELAAIFERLSAMKSEPHLNWTAKEAAKKAASELYPGIAAQDAAVGADARRVAA